MKKFILLLSLFGLLVSPVIGQLNVVAISSSGQTSAYSAEYQAVYDEFTTKPSAGVADAQNTLVETLVADGIWAKRDGIWLPAMHTNGNGEALLNLKDPTGATLSLQAGGASNPTFVAYEGFTTDGTNNYIDYGLGNLSALSLYALNSGGVSLYMRSVTITGTTTYLCGERDFSGGRTNISVVDGGGIWGTGTVNCTGYVQDNTASSAMWIGISRTASNAIFIMINSAVTTDIDASSQVGALPMIFGAYWYAGVANLHTAGQFSYMSVGSGLTQIEKGNERDAVEVYMDSNGKGIL